VLNRKEDQDQNGCGSETGRASLSTSLKRGSGGVERGTVAHLNVDQEGVGRGSVPDVNVDQKRLVRGSVPDLKVDQKRLINVDQEQDHYDFFFKYKLNNTL